MEKTFFDKSKEEVACIFNKLRKSEKCKECILNEMDCTPCIAELCEFCHNKTHTLECSYFKSIIRKILYDNKDVKLSIKDIVAEKDSNIAKQKFEKIKFKILNFVLTEKLFTELDSTIDRFKQSKEYRKVLNPFYESKYKKKDELLEYYTKIYREKLKIKAIIEHPRKKKRKIEQIQKLEDTKKRKLSKLAILVFQVSTKDSKKLNFDVYNKSSHEYNQQSLKNYQKYTISFPFNKDLYEIKKEIASDEIPVQNIIFRVDGDEIVKEENISNIPPLEQLKQYRERNFLKTWYENLTFAGLKKEEVVEPMYIDVFIKPNFININAKVVNPINTEIINKSTEENKWNITVNKNVPFYKEVSKQFLNLYKKYVIEIKHNNILIEDDNKTVQDLNIKSNDMFVIKISEDMNIDVIIKLMTPVLGSNDKRQQISFNKNNNLYNIEDILKGENIIIDKETLTYLIGNDKIKINDGDTPYSLNKKYSHISPPPFGDFIVIRAEEFKKLEFLF